jgi:hypothetical protein
MSDAEITYGGVAPCFVADAQVNVQDEVDAEYGGVEGIAAQGGDVVKMGE